MGTAITIAVSTAMNEIWMCCHRRCGIPSAPVQWSPLLNQSMMDCRNMSGPRHAPVPWRDEALNQQEQRVNDHRDEDDEPGRDREGGLEARVEAVEHERSEPAL